MEAGRQLTRLFWVIIGAHHAASADVYPEAQCGRLQALPHLVGVGSRIHGGGPGFTRRGVVEVGKWVHIRRQDRERLGPGLKDLDIQLRVFGDVRNAGGEACGYRKGAVA